MQRWITSPAGSDEHLRCLAELDTIAEHWSPDRARSGRRLPWPARTNRRA